MMMTVSCRATLAEEGQNLDLLYSTTLYGGEYLGHEGMKDAPETVPGLLFLRCVCLSADCLFD